jgi:hypothetical protein
MSIDKFYKASTTFCSLDFKFSTFGHDLIPDFVTKNERIFFIIIPRVFIGHLLYSKTNLYYFKFHWNKNNRKHHSSFLEKEKKSKTKLLSKTSELKMKLTNGRGEYHILAKCDDQYFCHFCYDRLPTFSDSFFLNTSVGNNNTDFDETLENTSNTPNSTSIASQ